MNLNSQRQAGIISATDFAEKLNYLLAKATEKDEKSMDKDEEKRMNKAHPFFRLPTPPIRHAADVSRTVWRL